jgi:hypothetical protein
VQVGEVGDPQGLHLPAVDPRTGEPSQLNSSPLARGPIGGSLAQAIVDLEHVLGSGSPHFS